MSGFGVLVSPQGAAPDPDVLHAMGATLRFRGPDAQLSWSGTRTGICTSRLRTANDGRDAPGPFSAGGRWWIAADARIDAQAQLRAQLRAARIECPADANDAELILHAYVAWGERCVERLAGDFSFAIWDCVEQTLFAARDAMGVKPLFYAPAAGGDFILSNHLPCVRAHPKLDRALDELAIADFLLFENNKDRHGTVFRSIRRLPSGHAMRVRSGRVDTWPYWEVPTPCVVERPREEHVEEFLRLLDIAVADRLRCDRVALHMSGGMDSASVAAIAATHFADPAKDLRGVTGVYDWLIPHDERGFAQAVADRLGIPIEFVSLDEFLLYEPAASLDRLPEPRHDPDLAVSLALHAASAKHARVVLTGWDGDALLSESPKPWVRHLLATGHPLDALRVASGYALSERRLPHAMAAWVPGRRRQTVLRPAEFPPWLNPQWSRELRLQERFRDFPAVETVEENVRPAAVRSLRYIQGISNFFDPYDPAWTGQAVDYRHPLLDLRVISFCLSLAPWPWCVRKHLLRESMKGRLPEDVRQRPKTPLAQPYWPFVQRLARSGFPSLGTQGSVGEVLSRFVDLDRLQPSSSHPGAVWEYLRVVSLGRWLNAGAA